MAGPLRDGSLLSGMPDNDLRIQTEQARWTLLAQIDRDHRAGMMWGDGGTLCW